MSSLVTEVNAKVLEDRKRQLLEKVRARSVSELRDKAEAGRLSPLEADVLEAIDDVDFLLDA